jgi:hypothetical protein
MNPPLLIARAKVGKIFNPPKLFRKKIKKSVIFRYFITFQRFYITFATL